MRTYYSTIMGIFYIINCKIIKNFISYGFVKDVRQVAKNNDLLTAKILSFDKESKHLKLSMKACLERNRYQKITLDPKWNKSQHYGLKDFTPLAEKLNEWIATELEKEEVKK